ncbi:MAG: histidine kinase [Marinifilaceae bacterium]
MKFQNKSILIVGVFIILSFAVAAYFIGEKMTHTAMRMSNDLAVSFAQNSFLVVKNELEESVQTVDALQRAIKREQNIREPESEVLNKILKSGLISKKELAGTWFVLDSGVRSSKGLDLSNSKYYRRGKDGIVEETLSSQHFELYKEVRSKGWEMISNPYKIQDGGLVISILVPLRNESEIIGVVGIDLDLYLFQKHFYDTEALGKAYVMIVSPHEYCITHPDEKQIGKKITTATDGDIIRQVLRSGKELKREVRSDYLKLPVLRVYQPILIERGSKKWLIAVSVPLFNVQESVHEIRNNVALIGLISAFLLMIFLYFSQNRWKYEFLKRQKAEVGRKEVMSKLSSILEGSDQIMIFSVDMNGCYTSFNSFHKNEMLEREGAEIQVGQKFVDGFRGEIAGEMQQYLERALYGGHFLVEYQRKGIHYQQIFNAIVDDSGQVVGASSIRFDISETIELRHRAQKEKEEKVEAQLKNLKNQINPHFLFNSLNSLYALVDEEPDLARQFVVKLSKVYRYLLDSNKSNLVCLSDELEFMKHYLFLQKIRFGENLRLENEISESNLHKRIPSVGLQSLVENAIKHNVVTSSQPLTIRLYVSGNCLVVENPYQPRPDIGPVSGTGLKNLEALYRFLGGQLPVFGIEDGSYRVKLPMLD